MTTRRFLSAAGLAALLALVLFAAQSARADDAVVSWLSDGGPLFTDPSNIPHPTPTPGQWRDLKLASATLNSGTPASKIVVVNGFAAAKRDGKSAMACVSFKNVANVAATRVVFEFPLLDMNGQELGEITLDRHGSFSPNVDIHTYPSYSDWNGGKTVNSGYADNCTTVKNGVAAIPILSARFASYRVTRVEYADGTDWTPASPAP